MIICTSGTRSKAANAPKSAPDLLNTYLSSAPRKASHFEQPPIIKNYPGPLVLNRRPHVEVCTIGSKERARDWKLPLAEDLNICIISLLRVSH